MEEEWPPKYWAASDIMQSFRLRAILRDPEGSIPVSRVPHAALYHLRSLLSDVATWDELASTHYAAITSVAAIPRDDCFEIRLVADCPASDRYHFMEKLCEAPTFWRWTIQGYTLLRVVPWLEWGGDSFVEVSPDEYNTIHELWAGQESFILEHSLTALIRGVERRFRAKAEWKNNRIYWKNMTTTYVFRDVGTWVEAHLDKIRELVDPELVVAESIVHRYPY